MDRLADFNRAEYEQGINERLRNYLYSAFVICAVMNGLIIAAIFKYSNHPHPVLACIQLTFPLIMWEMLLTFAFCPPDIMEHYLEEYLDQNALDIALLYLTPAQRRRFLRIMHSGGDLTSSNRASATNISTGRRTTDGSLSEPVLTERRYPSPFNFTG